MTATATIEALLADLSQDVGEAPAFDADGACLLQRDDGQEVVVAACDIAAAAIFYGPLCAALADGLRSIIHNMLETAATLSATKNLQKMWIAWAKRAGEENPSKGIEDQGRRDPGPVDQKIDGGTADDDKADIDQ